MRFFGGVTGNRGEATRLGSPSSGMRAFVQSERAGVKVNAHVSNDGHDVFAVSMTNGSRGSSSVGGEAKFLGYVVVNKDGDPEWRPVDVA